MKVLIVTHIDLDGSGVYILWKLAFPDADVIYVNYGWEDDVENRKKLLDYDLILFGDISFRPSFAELLNKMMEDNPRKKMILCDHHDSAINKFDEAGTHYPWMILDKDRCGTLIVYDQIKSNYPNFDEKGDYRRLAVLIDDYDRWVHNDPTSIDLQFLWNGMGREAFAEKFLRNPVLVFTPEELQIINENREKLQTSIIEAEKSMAPQPYVDIEGMKFNYCSNVPHFVSLVAMYVQKNHPELDYLVLNGGYGSISIRSTKCKINHIAEALGGGGHDLSAGCRVEPMMDIVTSVLNRIPTKYSFVEALNSERN